jgi:hypothetical protein
MISTENRNVTVGLSGAVSDGATILIPGMTASVVHYRHGTVIDPDPKSAPIGYDAPTKVASQKIDASLLPKHEPCILFIAFDANTTAGIERRSVYVLLLVNH